MTNLALRTVGHRLSTSLRVVWLRRLACIYVRTSLQFIALHRASWNVSRRHRVVPCLAMSCLHCNLDPGLAIWPHCRRPESPRIIKMNPTTGSNRLDPLHLSGVFGLLEGPLPRVEVIWCDIQILRTFLLPMSSPRR